MSEKSGWSSRRQKQEYLDQAAEALRHGEARENISCAEARSHWFVMARKNYVGNDPEPTFPQDMELGIHLARCPTFECEILGQAYKDILKPSQPEDSELLAKAVDQLESLINAPDN